MGKVGIDKSMSLDGYITGPNPGPDQGLGEGGERIFAWMIADPVVDKPTRDGGALSEAWEETYTDAFDATGAVIMGKGMCSQIADDLSVGW